MDEAVKKNLELGAQIMALKRLSELLIQEWSKRSPETLDLAEIKWMAENDMKSAVSGSDNFEAEQLFVESGLCTLDRFFSGIKID